MDVVDPGVNNAWLRDLANHGMPLTVSLNNLSVYILATPTPELSLLNAFYIVVRLEFVGKERDLKRITAGHLRGHVNSEWVAFECE